ncbi:MAG: glutamate--tRNA ligase [bacterium]|nr:glutamate--tRNA ligase [bacterium]
MGEVRVRFAPSPTGKLHIGGVRTALFNFLFAKKNSGKFILRIEDTDFERSKDEFLEDICNSLQWLKLNWDEGPDNRNPENKNEYFQSQRMEIYKEHAFKLLETGMAYRCFCSRERLDNLREKQKIEKSDFIGYDGHCRSLSMEEIEKNLEMKLPYTVRVKVPEGEISFDDMVREKITFPALNFDDFIILRSDLFPTYNFTVVVDDHLMNISHVIRGEDHISNTPKQIILYNAFKWEIPKFGHLPLIFGEDGKLLSKRHGAVSVLEFKEQGYLPEAIINFLALLGWSFDSEREVFSMEELIELFSVEKISKKAARFSYEKLLWYNTIYLNEKSPVEKLHLIKPYLLKEAAIKDWTGESEAKLLKLIEVCGDRIKKLPDLVFYAKPVFNEPESIDEKGEKKFLSSEENLRTLFTINSELNKINRTDFVSGRLEGIVRSITEREGLNPNKIFQAIRLILTGGLLSAGLFETMEIMGKETVVYRIEKYLKGKGIY